MRDKEVQKKMEVEERSSDAIVRRGNMEAKKGQRQMRREMGKTEQGQRGTKMEEKYKEGWRGTERGIERDIEG